MNRERLIYVGIIITLTMGLATTIILFTLFNNENWHTIASNFIFPLIYTMIGTIIMALVGTSIADKVLESYNKRLSHGLSERVIQLLGYWEFSERIQEDLQRSALIQNKIIRDSARVSPEADLIVLSLDLNWYTKPRKELYSKTASKLDSETASKLDSAEKDLRQVLKDIDDSQALIVLTVGKLDDTADITEELKKRRFSTLVNAQGRVLSDIHSLLTTLPPRY
jgi:hypothetical protein